MSENRKYRWKISLIKTIQKVGLIIKLLASCEKWGNRVRASFNFAKPKIRQSLG